MEVCQNLILKYKRNRGCHIPLFFFKKKGNVMADIETSKLITELETIKKEWLENLNIVKQQRKEYSELIDEVKTIRYSLKDIKE